MDNGTHELITSLLEDSSFVAG